MGLRSLAPLLRRPRRLDLRRAGITDAGARGLLALPADAALAELDLRYNGLGEDVCRSLVGQFGERVSCAEQ